MTSPRDDIDGLIERLRRHYTMSMFVTTGSLIACLIGEREEAATQLAALSARVKELEAELKDEEERGDEATRTFTEYSRLKALAEARALRAEQERDEAYERVCMCVYVRPKISNC